MKTRIILILGIIITNVICINSKRDKRNFAEFCAFPSTIRRIYWKCVYKYLPENEKTFISQCFGVSSFSKVLNLGCDPNQRENVQTQLEICLAEINTDYENFEGPEGKEEEIQSCLLRKLG